MNFGDVLTAYDRKVQRREQRIKAAEEAAVSAISEYFPEGKSNLDAPQILAACIELFDLGDKKDAGQLYLEWAVEHFVGRKVQANLEDIKAVYEALKAGGYTEKDYYEFNDMDNRLFYIPHRSKMIFCAESQNNRFIYILETKYGGVEFHIRRYYDEYHFDGAKDKWQRRDEKVYHEKGIHEAIANASWLSEHWSDCVEGNQYPDRPSLQYFKDRNFDPRYGDCRDIGYVLSYGEFTEPKADRAIFYYPEVKMAFFDLRCAVEQASSGFEGH